MLIERLTDHLDQFIHAYDIGEECISDHKTDQPESQPFSTPLQYLIGMPWRLCQHLLLCSISFYHVFHPAEDHLHKYGLRTSPTTKHPAKYHSKQGNEDDERDHPYSKNEKILWPEYLPEKDELTLQYIHQEQRMTVHLKKGQPKENNEVKCGKHSPQVIKLAFRLLRK